MGDKIKITGEDGDFSAYLAMPETLNTDEPAPGVVVIQEIFGVNENIKSIADWLAGQGFVALAPDLFWRLEPDVSLTDKTEEEWQKAFSLMNDFDPQKGVTDIQSTINTLRSHPACNGKAGLIGYCLGGKMAYMAACGTDIDAAVGYYGVGIQDMLAEAENISNPLMLHIAGKDAFVPPEAQAAIETALGKHPQITLHVYADDDHAFAREGGEHYAAASAATANDRTLNLLESVLAK